MEYLALCLILAAALAGLISNRVPADGVGLGVVVALMLTGEATPAEALSGFSHSATLTVAAFLILSAGVQRTGLMDGVAVWLRHHARSSETRLLAIQNALVTSVSTVLSNTATVGIFLPVVLSVTRERGFSVGRFLLPLSFAALLGGMCTLIGTSTNVVVASLVEQHGLAPLGMFEFTPVGLTMAVLGAIYLTVAAPRLLGDAGQVQDLAAGFHMRRYLTEVEIEPGSHLAGKTAEESRLSELYDMDVLEIHRQGSVVAVTPSTPLLERDVLLVRVNLHTIHRIQETEGVRLRSEAKIDGPDSSRAGMLLAEAVVPPGSPLENQNLKESAFRSRYGVTALALYHHREYIRDRVGLVPLRVGDVLLLYGSQGRLRELADSPEVLSVVKILPPRPRRRLARLAVLIVVFTIAAVALGLVSLVKAAVAGAALMVLTGCLSLKEAFRAMDRPTLLLIAGMIAFGSAMERSGAAAGLANFVMERFAGYGPTAILAGAYLTTSVLTAFVTNNACAVIMTPIVLVTAQNFGLDPRPFAFAVAFASSADFLTPWGYQTNMFVYGPGGYRLTDFLRVGLPLTAICFTVAMILIPRLWPLVATR